MSTKEQPERESSTLDSSSVTDPSHSLLDALVNAEVGVHIQHLTVTPPRLAIGTTLEKRYTITEFLGKGGAGEVYKAKEMNLQRDVAIKVLRLDVESDDSRKRLTQEMRTNATFSHPGIVTVHYTGTFHNDSPFLVMEYCPDSLARKIDAASKDAGPRKAGFDQMEAAALMIQVAGAVHYIHTYRKDGAMSHCDLKPQNILFDQNGNPRIADFGLATTVMSFYRNDATVGVTPEYASPEQVRTYWLGEPPYIDCRTDIWSLGVVLYRMLTGLLPFRGTKDELYSAILNSDPSPPKQLRPSLHKEIDAIVRKSLSKSADARYQTAEELQQALQAWLDNTNKITHRRQPGAGLTQPTATPPSPETEALYLASRHAYAESDFSSSYDLINRAYTHSPSNVSYLRQFVRVCFAQRNNEKVRELLRAGATVYPQDILKCIRGELLIRDSQPKKALELLSSIELRTDHNVEYHTAIAYLNIYESGGMDMNLLDAKAHLQLAEKYFPDHWWVKVNLLLIHRLLPRLNIVLLAHDENERRMFATKSLLETAIRDEPKLFSARLYRLLYYAIQDDRSSFDEQVVSDRDFFQMHGIQLPKNFPRSLLSRLRLLFADNPDALNHYQSALLSWFAT